MKRIIIYIATGTAALCVALMLKSCSGNKSIKVATEPVQARDITETVSADGNLEPTTIVKICPDVSGEITDLPVTEGQHVKRNDLLVKVYPDVYASAYEQASAAYSSSKTAITNAEAQLASSQAQYDNLKAVYDRDQKLLAQGAIAQADFDAAKAQFEAADANLKSAQENIDASKFNAKSSEENMNQAHENLLKTSILSPLDGVVVGLTVKQGERVVGTAMMAGTEMFSVADLAAMEADVKVNENDIVYVKSGDTAYIEVDAFANRKFKGIVTEVSNSANVTGTSVVDQVTNFTVKIHILPSSYADLIPAGTHDSPFRPGMSATAEIEVKYAKNVLSCPIEAVTTRKSGGENWQGGGQWQQNTKGKADNVKVKVKDTVQECVFLYAKSRVRKQIVTTGIQDANYIELKTGVKKDDEVVTAPFSAISQALRDSMQVEKVDKSQLYSGQQSWGN